MTVLITGSAIFHEYNQADQRTRATREDGAYWDYSYDALGQVVGGTKKTAAGQTIPGMTFGYSYDDIGNRKTSTTGVPAHESVYTANLLNQYTLRTVPGWFDLLGSANPAAKVSVTSPADSASPVAVHASTRLGPYWHAAVPVSNSTAAARQSLKVTGVLKGQGADGKDIVAEQAGNLFVPQTPEAFTYDDDGNLLTDGRWAYTWDGENRLTAMETQNGIGVSPMMRLVFAYGGQARRVSKQVYAWTSGAWALQSETRFLYDGWNLIAEFAVDPATQARTLKTAYAWGLDLSGSLQGAGGVGGLLASAIAATGTTNYFGYDGNGNVAALANAGTGAVSGKYEYDPFGSRMASEGTFAGANPFGFATNYLDYETGRVYYINRYYASEIGRWLSRDPIESFKTLLFVDNNTLNMVDRLGLWGESVHFTKTGLWAYKAGFTINASFAVATADENVDKEYLTSYWPGPGQKYHFNTNEFGEDSRERLFKEHMVNAKNYCTDGRNDRPIDAAIQLGKAIHPKQDWVAHGDFGSREGMVILTIHNEDSPEPGTWYLVDREDLDALGGPNGRPAGDAIIHEWSTIQIGPGRYSSVPIEYARFIPGTQRIKLTEGLTTGAVIDFKNHVKEQKSCCQCKEFFIK